VTLEDVLAIVEREKPQGVIVQFGGQTPLNLALELKRNGVPIVGTAPESIDLAEDRRRFGAFAGRAEDSAAAQCHSAGAGRSGSRAGEIGLPVLVRPSYVLGGRAMVIAYDVNTVQEYVAKRLMGPPARADRSIPRGSDRNRCGCAGRWNGRGYRELWSTSKKPECTRGFLLRAAAR